MPTYFSSLDLFLHLKLSSCVTVAALKSAISNSFTPPVPISQVQVSNRFTRKSKRRGGGSKNKEGKEEGERKRRRKTKKSKKEKEKENEARKKKEANMNVFLCR